jgi:proteasome lid subunit RPN8/RPN11
MIVLEKGEYEKLVVYAKSHLPEEACGLLGGTEEGDRKVIKKLYFLENADHSPEHFSLNGKEQLAAILNMRNNNLVPLGNWHSHPATPARQSEEDIRLAYDPKASYLILSFEEEIPLLKSFRTIKGKSFSEELIVK